MLVFSTLCKVCKTFFEAVKKCDCLLEVLKAAFFVVQGEEWLRNFLSPATIIFGEENRMTVVDPDEDAHVVCAQLPIPELRRTDRHGERTLQLSGRRSPLAHARVRRRAPITGLCKVASWAWK